MGGNQVYGPELPDMPADMSRARRFAWNQISGNFDPTQAPFDFNYTPNSFTSAAGNAYKSLLGTLGSPGGPQPGQGLEGSFPMWSGASNLSDTLKQGIDTGFLGDTTDLWNAKKNLYSMNAKDLWNSAYSGILGGGGGRGTGLVNAIGDIANRQSTQLSAEMAPFDFNNIQAAQDRRLQASQLGMSFTDLINQEARARTAGMEGFGQGQFQNTQTMQDKAYQEWLRQQPGYGPMWQHMMTYAMNYPFQGQTPDVQPPWWQDLLSSLIGAGGNVAAATIGAGGAPPVA